MCESCEESDVGYNVFDGGTSGGGHGVPSVTRERLKEYRSQWGGSIAKWSHCENVSGIIVWEVHQIRMGLTLERNLGSLGTTQIESF